MRDLSRDRHAVTLGLRGDGNARGAEDVLAWQTGFAAAVSFARGHPREPRGAAALLDAARSTPRSCLASDRSRSCRAPARAADGGGRRAAPRAHAARVTFATAADGIEVPGTAHRMDGVPVPLRAPLAAERPAVEDVLAAIAERL